MNLHYLISKHDPNIAATDKISLTERQYDGKTWRGLILTPDDKAQVRIRSATNFHPFRDRAETIGWRAAADVPGPFLSVQFALPGGGPMIGEAIELRPESGFEPVRLPWSLEVAPPADGLDLVLHVPPASPGPIFLGVHWALDRSRPVALCKGHGVEIGPGAQPQIMPGPDVDVSYLEQMPSEEWRRLYGRHYEGDLNVDEGLWDRYRVGDAHRLPFEDASLDFIFTSHVFEHLANPLGHLEIWAAKLRKGGKVVAVIPDLSGAKDYRAELSSMPELVAEYRAGSLEPTYAHYERYARAMNIAGSIDRLWAEKRSIHIHFYTHSNIAALMREAMQRFGYQGFSIVHSPNHKDFHLVAIR